MYIIYYLKYRINSYLIENKNLFLFILRKKKYSLYFIVNKSYSIFYDKGK